MTTLKKSDFIELLQNRNDHINSFHTLVTGTFYIFRYLIVLFGKEKPLIAAVFLNAYKRRNEAPEAGGYIS